MKSLYLSTILILMLANYGYSQTPYLFNYQAIVRNGAGVVLSNQNVGFKISILQGTITGSAVFSETHIAATNDYGLVNLQIGNGTNFGPQLSSIVWSADEHFLKIEIDPAGGIAYSITSTSQLISVPYALMAENVVNNNDADANPTNEYNTAVNLNGTDLEISDLGNTITVDLSSLVDDADANPTNEIQILSKVGPIITLSNGGGAVIDDVTDADANPTNEMNVDVTLVGNILSVIDGGSSQSVDLSLLANDADANPTNEMNIDVTLVGTMLNVIDAGSIQSVDLAVLGNDADANPNNEMNVDVTFVGTVLSVIDAGSTQFVDLVSLGNDADANPSNEMNSDVTLVGTTLNVIDGGSTQSVNLASLVNDADANPTNEIQNLTIVGSNLSISGGNTVVIPGGSDSQMLTLVGSDLSISGGNTVTLGGGTDSQFLSIVGSDITISNGNTITIPSGGTDSQTLTFVGTNLTIAGGNTVNLSSLVNDADANPSNEMNIDVTLVGTTLNVIDGGSTQSVDLAALGNDADANPTNEMNTDVTLVGTVLNVIDGGSTQSVDLASLSGSSTSYKVGQYFGGGIIVFVDSTGQHGLICAFADLVGTYIFENLPNSTTIYGTSTHNGALNTTALVANVGDYVAAEAADAYAAGGFTNWYLPSLYELELVFNSGYVMKQFALTVTGIYWSSTETGAGIQAYRLTNNGILGLSQSSACNVRPMRTF